MDALDVAADVVADDEAEVVTTAVLETDEVDVVATLEIAGDVAAAVLKAADTDAVAAAAGLWTLVATAPPQPESRKTLRNIRRVNTERTRKGPFTSEHASTAR
jgi:hypothetical protein